MRISKIIVTELVEIPWFSKEEIRAISKKYQVKEGTMNAHIHKMLRRDLIQLKNGVYVTSEYYQRYKMDMSYSFYLANVLRKPSYISSWTALQYYGMVTEEIYGIISVTPKVTRVYENKIGTYTYHSMKKGLFTGFVLKKEQHEFFIARPAKALFDLLYFKTKGFASMTKDDIYVLIDELRVDIDEMDEEEKAYFEYLLNLFIK